MSKVSFISSSTVKSIACASILALALLSFPMLSSTAAQSSGAADGSISYSLEDGFTKSIKFTAVANSDGSASGHMTFSGPADFPNQDVDGTGRAGFSGKIENLFIQAEFDGMAVVHNRAVMTGVVTGATLSDYIGQRMLLVVEDNSESIGDRAGDKFTWGIYKPAEDGWIPADAELQEDNGWSMTWLATDAERRGDEGIQITRKWALNCQSFPLSSYDFADIIEGDGNIKVQQ